MIVRNINPQKASGPSDPQTLAELVKYQHKQIYILPRKHTDTDIERAHILLSCGNQRILCSEGHAIDFGIQREKLWTMMLRYFCKFIV